MFKKNNFQKILISLAPATQRWYRIRCSRLTNKHDGDFLPWSQQFEIQGFRYGDQAMVRLRVEGVTFLHTILVLTNIGGSVAALVRF